MPQATGEARTRELEAAQTLVNNIEELSANYPALKTSVEELKGHVEKLKTLDEQFKGVDIKKTIDSVEEIKLGHQRVVQMIRNSRGGIYIPGLGENKESFSLVKLMSAVVSRNWDGAGYEKKVVEEAQKVVKATGHVIGHDSQGGFFVPDQVIADVIGAIYASSVLINQDGSGQQRMSVLDGLVGIPATIPKFLGGMLAYWIGEQDPYIESAAKVGNISLRPRKLGILTRLTDEMRRFQGYGFEGLMRADMARSGALAIDFAALYGTKTDNMPGGLFSNSGIQYYYAETNSDAPPTGDAIGGELGYDDLMNMQGLVEDSNIPVDPSWAWIAHPKFFRRRRQDKVQMYNNQTSQMGYLTGTPAMTEDALRSLIGDFGKATQNSTVNTAGQTQGLTPDDPNEKKFGDVIGGNWRDAVVGRWGGVEIVEDQGLGQGFASDEVFIKTRMYLDFAFRIPQAFVAATDVRMR